MPKTVIINGSPKGGASNTLMLARAFVRSQPQEDVEIIDLSRERVEFCTGCYSCWMRTPGKCIHNDDADKIHAKLKGADFLVWSLPLYSYGIPAKAKALIERSLPYSLPLINDKGTHPLRGERRTGQKAALISTAGFYKKTNNFEGISVHFDALYRDNVKILCPQGELLSKPPFRALAESYFADVALAGAEFIESGAITPETRQKVDRLLYPIDKFVRLANANWGVDGQGRLCGLPPPVIHLNQMAVLYNGGILQGRKVIEFNFPDFACRCQMVMDGDCRIITGDFGASDTRVVTDFSVWSQISNGVIHPAEAAQSGKMRVEGDVSLLAMLEKIFCA